MIHIQNKNIDQTTPTAVTIGNFDGMHLGHVKLIQNIIDQAKENNLKSLVLSFNPHPRKVLFNEGPLYIMDSEEKVAMLKSMGIDIFIDYPFDKDFSSLSPNSFLEDFLLKRLKCAAITVGKGYRFGYNGKGSIEHIKVFAEANNIALATKLFEKDGQPVSSTRIRNFIGQGDVKAANYLLGRNFSLKGIIGSGQSRGAALGFPTANLIFDKNKLLPGNGVYATQTILKGETFKSITNVGKIPTFDGTVTTVETYILNFSRNIYGESIAVNFLDKLRGEKKFSSVEELKSQILKDVEFVKMSDYTNFLVDTQN